MDLDTVVNGLAHELWAMAQGRAPIEDVVTPMMAELLAFADAVRGAEREACAAVCRQLENDKFKPVFGDAETVTGYDCSDAILMRPNVEVQPRRQASAGTVG